MSHKKRTLFVPPPADVPAARQERYTPFDPDPSFLALLEALNKKGLIEAERQRRLLEAYYGQWASAIQWLHREFRNVWSLFGTIEGKVQGWFRSSPHGGDFDYLAVTKGGYSFGAGVEKNTGKGVPYPEKWLVVSFGWASGPSSGIGDERALGRTSKVDATLVGLEECVHSDVNEQARAARLLYERIMATPLTISLHHPTLGQEHRRLSREALGQRSLARLCQQLFAALNRDELEGVRALLPESTDAGKSKPRRLLGM